MNDLKVSRTVIPPTSFSRFPASFLFFSMTHLNVSCGFRFSNDDDPAITLAAQAWLRSNGFWWNEDAIELGCVVGDSERNKTSRVGVLARRNIDVGKLFDTVVPTSSSSSLNDSFFVPLPYTQAKLWHGFQRHSVSLVEAALTKS